METKLFVKGTMEVVEKYGDDSSLMQLLCRNAVYTSAEIQNTLLHIMGEMVRGKISTEEREAGVYSILVDETKDSRKTEQMAIVVRYVDVQESTIHEIFLTYVAISSLDAKSLTEYILETLKTYNLNSGSIESQGYNGASVISGKCVGVQKRVKEVVPMF